MAERAQKLFAGTRIRRLRRELNITQLQMAGDLGISPSYLNLIERNQRPLSAQILLRLADTFDIDLKEFSGDDQSHAAASLKEVFSDPVFADMQISNAELTDLVGASPSAAQGVGRSEERRVALPGLPGIPGRQCRHGGTAGQQRGRPVPGHDALSYR